MIFPVDLNGLYLIRRQIDNRTYIDHDFLLCLLLLFCLLELVVQTQYENRFLMYPPAEKLRCFYHFIILSIFISLELNLFFKWFFFLSRYNTNSKSIFINILPSFLYCCDIKATTRKYEMKENNNWKKNFKEKLLRKTKLKIVWDTFRTHFNWIKPNVNLWSVQLQFQASWFTLNINRCE